MTITEIRRPRMGDLKDAAAQLNCSVSTIRRRVHDGTIPAVRLGRSIRIDLDALPGRTPSALLLPARSSLSGTSGPRSGGASPEVVAALVSEVVMAAPVLTESHMAAMAGLLRDAWTPSAQ